VERGAEEGGSTQSPSEMKSKNSLPVLYGAKMGDPDKQGRGDIHAV